ncbi:MAG TPA: pilus assembly protein PilM [Gammaproteobacteria bacterium]|nr:pilus assembly protein PilM [Gammaproteobacteria bacterium]
MTRWREAADRLMNVRRTRPGPIGLHMAREAIHLVQLDLHAAGVAGIRAWASVPLPADSEDVMQSPKRLKLLLRKALVSGGFKGRKVVSAMPHGKVKIHSLTYRVTRERSEAEEILHLMAERLGGELAEHVLDFLPVRESGPDGERLALVTVSRREEVIGYLELLREAGLEVLALEIGPAAIRRLVCAMSPAGEPENVLVINAGDRASFMTMISGRRLLFDQEIDFGERKLLELVARSLDMPSELVRALVVNGGLDDSDDRQRGGLAQADISAAMAEILHPELKRLVTEIERAFLYAASETRGRGLRRVYLVGSIARWPGADRRLSALAGIPVTNIPDPLAALSLTDGQRLPERAIPEIAVATGLALREVASAVRQAEAQ